MYSLADIGNYLKLRDEIDPNNRATNKIRSGLAVVDLYPVKYVLKLSELNKSGQWAIEYDFAEAMGEYAKLCTCYGLTGYQGLRLWLTDETTASEEFANVYDKNVIETAINSLSGATESIRDILQSTGNKGLMDAYNAAVGNVTSWAQSTSGSMVAGIGGITGMDANLQKTLSDSIQGSLGTAAEVVFKGKHLSLPKIWKSSTYSPSLTLAVKLVSPYGDPKAIRYFIAEPLIHMILLACPVTSDGLSYGTMKPIRVQGYGITNMNLASIESVSIRRGGRETSYNQYKQPLTLDVMLNIKPLADGFAACECPGMDTNISAVTKYYDEEPAGGSNWPAITTVGNVIQSLRPAPSVVWKKHGITR